MAEASPGERRRFRAVLVRALLALLRPLGGSFFLGALSPRPCLAPRCCSRCQGGRPAGSPSPGLSVAFRDRRRVRQQLR